MSDLNPEVLHAVIPPKTMDMLPSHLHKKISQIIGFTYPVDMPIDELKREL